MTVQKFNALAVDANAASKTRNNLDTLALLVEEIKAIRRAMGCASGGTGAGYLVGSESFATANPADGAGITSTGATVTGAALGDFVLAAPSVDMQGGILTAYVSATNTVKSRYQNESGGAVTVGTFTVKYIVIPQAAAVAALVAMALTQTAGTAS